LGRASTLRAEINIRKIETPSLKYKIHDNIKIILVGNLDGENEGKSKVYYL